MKIFLDWMHRKLHPMDVKYTQVPQKKGEEAEEIADQLLMVAEEKEALLLHDMLRGILTIGTLGQYQDPFRPSPPFLEEEAIGLDDDEEEEAPVVVTIEDPLGVINKEEEEEEEEITVTVESQERVVEVETKILQEDLPLLKEDKERRERGRTTLADLFAADPAVREDANVNKGTKKSSNGDCKQSHKIKKKKKVKELVEEEEEGEKKKKKNGKSRSSSSKLLKLMTRMLKKKIHPESITSAEAAAAESIDKHDVISSSNCSLAYW